MERIEALEEAIQKKNLVGIYSVFYTIAHGDPAFSTGKFEEALAYVKSRHIDGFLQEFDGDEFEPEENWNEEYWAFLASTLIDNFCEIRIDHLKQVGRKVYPARQAAAKVNRQRQSNSINMAQHARPHLTEEQKAKTRQKNEQNWEMEFRNKGNIIDKIRSKLSGGKR